MTSKLVIEVPVTSILAGSNDRTVFNADALAELADSIRENGLAQPITVRPAWLFSCGYSIAKGDDWKSTERRPLRSSATRQGSSMGKGAFGSKPPAIDTTPGSAKAPRTMASDSCDGSNQSGPLAPSMHNANGTEATNGSNGTGASTPPAKSDSSWVPCCPICTSNEQRQSEPFSSSQPTAEQGGRRARTDSSANNGQSPASETSPCASSAPKRGSATERENSDFQTNESMVDECKGRSGYLIVAGERRFRACSTLLKWNVVPAIITELSDEQASAIMLAENVARADLDQIDEANAYRSRMTLFGWGVDEVAKQAGVSPARVNAKLRLLNLREEIQQLVRTGALKDGWGQMIAAVPLDPNRQMVALRLLQENPSPQVSWMKRLVSTLYEEQCSEAMFDIDAFVLSSEVEKMTQVTVDPPRPGVDVPPTEGNDLCDIITRQMVFWQNASVEWDRQGKGYPRNECRAAADALRALLSGIGEGNG